MTKQHENHEGEISNWESKIFIIDKCLGVAGCGLKTDLKIIVKRARKIAKNFSFVFGRPISTNILATELSNFFQEFTYSVGVRPFGSCIFVIGFGDEGPELFQINPDGDVFCIKANIIGKKANCGLQFLNKRWNKNLSEEETIFISFFSLKEAIENKLKISEINLGVIDKEGVFKILNKKQIQLLFSEIDKIK
jgi:20S proteasome alpha/beta subunit